MDEDGRLTTCPAALPSSRWWPAPRTPARRPRSRYPGTDGDGIIEGHSGDTRLLVLALVAKTAAWVRLASPSFARIAEKWFFTVFYEIPRHTIS